MNAASPSATARLQRLDGYLRQDPENAALRAEACEAALACGRNDLAEGYLAEGERMAPQLPQWQFQRAHLCIARRDLASARALLEPLRRTLGDLPVLVHDLAYVALLQGDASTSHALLQPWMQACNGDDLVGRMQAHWLRACHHLGRLEEGWAWARSMEAEGALHPDAAGVASLIGVDLDEVPAACALAQVALAADEAHPEALVALGSAALSAGAPGEALPLFERALRRNPDDGRTWSASGFANLLAGRHAEAGVHFEKALETLPDHVPTWQALGWTRILLGDRNGAMAAFAAALARDEDSAQGQATQAIAHIFAGEREAGARHLARAERIDPEDGTTVLARVLMAGHLADGDPQDVARRLLSQWRPRP